MAAATMATMNVVAGVATTSAISTPVSKASSCNLAFSSIRGQRLVSSSKGAGAVSKSRNVQVRAEDNRGAGKQLQDLGEDLSAKVQETAENVRDSLQGAQSDASSKASSAARTGQSKLEQGADDAEGLGAKIGNQAENLKNQLFGAGEDAQADAKKNLNKAQSAASSKGKEAEVFSGTRSRLPSWIGSSKIIPEVDCCWIVLKQFTIFDP